MSETPFSATDATNDVLDAGSGQCGDQSSLPNVDVLDGDLIRRSTSNQNDALLKAEQCFSRENPEF